MKDPELPAVRALAIKATAATDALARASRQGLLLGAIGDSRIEQAIGDSGQSFTFRSVLYWIGALTRARVRFDPAITAGVSGNTTTQALVRLPALINAVKTAGGDGILWYCATNDPANGILPDTTAANMTSAVTQIRAAGLLVFIIVETPRGYSGTSFPYAAPSPTYAAPSEPLRGYHQQNTQFQRWMQSLPGVYVIDAVRRTADLTVTDGSPRQDLFWDGLHPAAPASFLIGSAAADVINALLPEPSVLVNTSSDISKSGNIWGNLLFGGMVQGTGGTKGANASGNLADTWSCSTNDTGLTAMLSKVTSTSSEGVPETWQQVVVGGAGPTVASPAVTFTCVSTTPGPTPDGCQMEAGIEIQVDAGASRIRSLNLILNCGTGTNFAATGSLPSDYGDMSAYAWNGVLLTPRFTIPAGGVASKTLNFVINTRQGYAPSATIRFRRATFRRIT